MKNTKTAKMGKLVIARHHESEWNKLGLWTGTREVHLTPYGQEMSGKMGEMIRDISIDRAFVSGQLRAQETLAAMLAASGREKIPTTVNKALNERDYGDYTGKNKWEMKQLIGEKHFDSIRRDWDCPVPNGETLKMVYERAVPYFQKEILPALQAGDDVLIAAHGNSIRALMKYIESLPDEAMRTTEMPFGAILIYDLDEQGKMLKKEVMRLPSEVNA